MLNSVTINLDMLGTFMKSNIVGKKDCSLVITIHGHSTKYWKTKLLKKTTYSKHLRGSMHHSMVFSFGTGERDNMLFFTPPRDKVPANEWAIPINRILITTIACISRVRVGLYVKITALSVEKTTSRSLHEIGENKKSSLPIDLLSVSLI